MDRVQLLLLFSKSWICCHSPRWVCWHSSLLLKGEIVYPSFLPLLSLQSTGICATSTNKSQSPTNSAHSRRGKLSTKKAQFSPGLVIWTGLLGFVYNQHYRQCKGMVQHQTARSRRETARLSPESHIKLYQLRQNHSNSLLLLVIPWHSYTIPFLTPSLSFISQNFPISTKGKIGWVSQRGQGS